MILRIITDYNKYMGGVDNFDKYISYYQVQHSGKHKWYIRIINYLIDLALVNSFMLYRKS